MIVGEAIEMDTNLYYFSDVDGAYMRLLEHSDCSEKITKKERDLILKYIFVSPIYCVRFLENGLYQNDREKKKALKRVFNSYTASSALLLSNYKNKLSSKEINQIKRMSLKHWDSALKLYKANLFDEHQKAKAFEIISLNRLSSIEYLKTGTATLEQRIHLLDLNIHGVAHNIIVYYPLKENERVEDRIDRKIAIERQCEFFDSMYQYALNGLLTFQEKKKIFDTWGNYWFENTKCKFEAYYGFCKAFQEFLNDHQWKLFFGKFTRNSNSKHTHKLKDACNDFYIPEIKIKIEALAVAFTLKKASQRN